MERWVTAFQQRVAEDPTVATAVAAIAILVDFITESQATTISELREDLKLVIRLLTESTDSRITSVSSGCELFLRFITLKADFNKDFEETKKGLVQSGQMFLRKARQGRAKIAPKGMPFIRDGTTVLCHGYSRSVLTLLELAAKANKRFTVYVTEGRPVRAGLSVAAILKEEGIPSTIVPDTAVAYVMEKVDLVLSGAEAVVESGGIINSIGTFQIGVVAKAFNKPFYVVAESFKFVRLFPLSQQDLPPQRQQQMEQVPEELASINPLMDYTPPSYITLLFTDLGVLTPSAVSDELIKLYY